MRTGKSGEVVLDLYVQPRSSRNRLVGIHGDALKVCVTAAPVDNKANKAVVNFLAGLFKISKRDITVVAGHTGRRKKVAVFGVAERDVRNYVNHEIGKK